MVRNMPKALARVNADGEWVKGGSGGESLAGEEEPTGISVGGVRSGEIIADGGAADTCSTKYEMQVAKMTTVGAERIRARKAGMGKGYIGWIGVDVGVKDVSSLPKRTTLGSQRTLNRLN